MLYFNDNEPYVVEWLGNLWPDAHVDGRSVLDVRPEDVAGHTRCHFFAGIGGWEYALQLAGWPATQPVWTASLPCQPFSTAGKRRGIEDERHLWPQFRDLVEQCRPPVLFGEQVASKDGRAWLAGVRADLEALGYAVGAADLCAAGVGAPHIRQRLYWVAYSPSLRREQRGPAPVAALQRDSAKRAGEHTEPEYAGVIQGRPEGLCGACGLGHFWSRFDIAYLTDGTARRIEPGSFPLAHGVSNRVGRIRAYGGSIVPQVAQVFIESFMEAV